MAEESFQSCLKLLNTAENDNDRLAALLLVTKLAKADCSAEDRRQLFETVGFTFINRLLRTDKVPDGCSDEAYKSVALSVLSAFCSEPSLVIHPDMLKNLPIFHKILLNDSPPPSDDEDGKEKPALPLPPHVQDTYDCLTCICLVEPGQKAALEQGTASVLSEVYHNDLAGRDKALELTLMLAEKCGPAAFMKNPQGLLMLLNRLSFEFSNTQEEEKFNLCLLLCRVVAATDRPQLEELPSRAWAINVHLGVSNILQSRIGAQQREPALRLASIMVRQCGIDWALHAGEEGQKFLLLLSHLACIEVRMALEDRTISQVNKQEDVLSACYCLLESIISFMTLGASLAVDSRQVTQLHAAMVGAFKAVTIFLKNIQDEAEEKWIDPVVIATVRVLGSWIAEETLALGDEVRELLPFLLNVSTKTFELAKSRPPTEDDVCEVLRFLLPGLCHLSADEKTRPVLMEKCLPQLLVDYMFYQWHLFTVDSNNRPAEVAMTTMCGVFMNLVVIEESTFPSDPSAEELLMLLINNISCFSHSNSNHIVLFYNWAVLGLMLLRRLTRIFDSHSDSCASFIRHVCNLFAHAHVTDNTVPEPRDPPVPYPRLGISDSAHQEWPNIAEFWFLGMQTLAHLLSQFPQLTKVVLKTGWLPTLLRMLGEVKGTGMDMETAISYRSFLLAMCRSSPRALKVIKEKGGIKVSRIYKFEELEKILTT